MAEPFLVEKQQLALKIESTIGTDAVVAAADVIHPAFDADWEPAFTFFERNAVDPSFSRNTQISGEHSATITFATELKGSGTAGTVPPNFAQALRACGFGETIVGGTSVTYAPVSTSTESATVVLFEESGSGSVIEKKILGARGTVALEHVKGQPVLLRFTFTGRYVEPAAGVLLTVPVSTPLPEAFLAVAFSIHGVGATKIQNLTLDMANEVVLRNDANQATGNFSGVIVDRNPGGSIDPEQEELATINFFNKITNNAEGILTYVLGSTGGNIVTLTAPKAQFINGSEGDRDKIRIENIDLALNRSADAGDDEIIIALT